MSCASSVKNVRASIRSTCSTGGLRSAGRAAGAAAEAAPGRSPNRNRRYPSWMAWAAAKPSIASPWVSPEIRMTCVGAAIGTMPSGWAPAGDCGPLITYAPLRVPVVRAPTEANVFVHASTIDMA